MSDSGIRFAEVMTGFVAFAETDYQRGAGAGRETGNSLKLDLVIEVDDLQRFVGDPSREARIAGWVDCDSLGGRLPIERGIFNLLVGSDDEDRKRMLYRIFFRDGVGHLITLVGEKLVGPPGLHVWSDTTTLYIQLQRGYVEREGDHDPEVVASGIVRIRPLGFARQLTTFRASGRSLATRFSTIVRFDTLFARQLWRAYGQPGLRLVSRQRSADADYGGR
jgi:hypothetical protein